MALGDDHIVLGAGRLLRRRGRWHRDGKLGRRVLQAGLVVEAVGLLATFGVLQSAGTGVETIDLIGPMIVGGFGMGMVFVPLFDIVLAGVAPHEVGSATGVLQSANGLGMALGVAALGAVFFALAGGSGAGHDQAFVDAAQWTILLTVALLVVSFVVAYLLPRRAREQGHGPAQRDERDADMTRELPVAA